MTSHPHWLNAEVFAKILNGANIIELSVKEAVAPGDHYFSKLLRVAVRHVDRPNGALSTTSFIVKAFPDGVIQDFMIEYGAMSREMNMYRYVMPVLNEITKRKLSPNCYDSPMTEALILEDLTLKGFSMEDRISQMDYDHCKFAIEALAEFHGASIILNETRPHLIDKVGKEVLYTEDNEHMQCFLVNSFNVLGNEVKNWPESSKYSSKLLESGAKIWENMVSAMKPLKDDVLVLNHGDFWTNNILFLHNDSGAIEKVEFIDFQFCRWTSPAFDLQRFFYTSVRDLEDIPKLIGCYLNCINEFLKCRGNETQISSEQIGEYLDRMKCYALVCAVSLLPTCVQTRDEPLDYKQVTVDNYDASFNSSNPYVKACKDVHFRRIVSRLLDRFCEISIL